MTWFDFILLRLARRYLIALSKRFSMEHKRVYMIRTLAGRPRFHKKRVVGKMGALDIFFGGEENQHHILRIMLTREQMDKMYDGLREVLEAQDEQYFTYRDEEMIDVNTIWDGKR